MEKKGNVNAKLVEAFFTKSNTGVVCRVQSSADIDLWHSSKAFFNLITYINDVSTEIQGIRFSDSFPVSENIRRLTTMFNKLDKIILANPPAPQLIDMKASASLDLGNKSYRRWSRSMLRDIYHILEGVVPAKNCRHVNELGQYLSGAFGNSTKIEYGIGHELSFLFFICSLFEAEILRRDEDLAASALILFNRYLKSVRRLQVAYSVVSANCQGAYALDRFQFVPFIWGVAQLCHEAPFSPQKMLDTEIMELYKNEYLLIDCVKHIADTNVGPFASHSNQLWSLAALSSWTKIHRGLMFMYREDILVDIDTLSALPFGELMSFEKSKSGRQVGHARLGVMSPLRCPLSKQEQTPRNVSSLTSSSEMTVRWDYVYSDALSNSGISMGSDCTSLSGVSVNLPTWMDDDSPSKKK